MSAFRWFTHRQRLKREKRPEIFFLNEESEKIRSLYEPKYIESHDSETGLTELKKGEEILDSVNLVRPLSRSTVGIFLMSAIDARLIVHAAPIPIRSKA